MNSIHYLIIGLTVVLIIIALYYQLRKRIAGPTSMHNVTPRSVLEIIKILQALVSIPRLRELRINQNDSPKVFLDSPEEASMTYGEIVEWAGLPFGSLPYEIRDDLGNTLGDLSQDGARVFVNKIATENPVSFLAILCREISRKGLLDCGLNAEAADPAFLDVTCAYLGFSTLLLNSRYDVRDVYISDAGVSLSLFPPGIEQKYLYESRYIPVGVSPADLIAASHLLS